MSVSSLVSFSRLPIFLEIPTLRIGRYELDACVSDREPKILKIQDTFYTKTNVLDGEDRISVSSFEVAQCLVQMHMSSQIFRTVESEPAVLAIDRELDIEDFDTSHYHDEYHHWLGMLRDKALIKQRNWFIGLLEMAYQDYSRYNNVAVVSHIQKLAARELKYDRPWNRFVHNEAAKPSCEFCGTELFKPDAPVCPNCHNIINAAAYESLKLRVASHFEVSSEVKG